MAQEEKKIVNYIQEYFVHNEIIEVKKLTNN